ncbi:MAG: class D sortase [Xanthomonadaceae bacterium]|nr:class D sortase [Xanthomonadaceae bacterium]
MPGVNLEVPVFADISERNLSRGAGWVPGTALPNDGGNMAIAAHRDQYFRALKDVAVGDLLELESLSGPQDYRVTSLTIVEPEDLWPLDPADVATVTLVTCYPFYFVGSAPQRYIVQAVAVD